MVLQHESLSVNVTGEGVVYITPDQVTVKVRVENADSDPKTVKQENDTVVSHVFRVIKTLAIAKNDIKTDYIRHSKNYDHHTKIHNFEANQSIVIHLKDLSIYEPLMDSLLASGINRIDGVTFSASNENTLKAEARIKAVENAKEKTDVYAAVLDQKIGKAVIISEFQPSTGSQRMLRTMAMDGNMNNGQKTMAPGELEIRVQVNVSFELL